MEVTKPGAVALLFALALLLAGCGIDSNESVAKFDTLQQQNLQLKQRLSRTTDSFEEQCIAAGFVNGERPAEEAKVAAAVTHPEGECLECHESHGKPDCSHCHDMQGMSLAAELSEANLAALQASFPQPVDIPRQGDIDGLTGASGDYYYGPASYLDAAYLASRVNGMHSVYRWKQDPQGVNTLEQACQLPERPGVDPLYPDDGQPYSLSSTRNQLGAKLVSTVNSVRDEATGEWSHIPNIATFGYGMREEGGKFYVTLKIGKNNSCHNAITSGDMRFSYYEYSPSEPQKHIRNRGARILGRVDYGRTALQAPDWKTELSGLGVGESFIPEDVDWEQVGACELVVEVVGIIPLG